MLFFIPRGVYSTHSLVSHTAQVSVRLCMRTSCPSAQSPFTWFSKQMRKGGQLVPRALYPTHLSSGSHELLMCTCHMDTKKTGFISQSLLSKNGGLTVPVFRLQGHFTIKKEKREVKCLLYVLRPGDDATGM